MAKEFLVKSGKLEENGIINVLFYFRDKYEKSDKRLYECSNCSKMFNHKHVYEYMNKDIINICVHCNKKVNNLNTLNPKFKK